MVESSIPLDQIPSEFEDGGSRGGCGSCGSGKAADGLSRCGNGLEKIYPTTAVRFGYMRYIGEFSHVPEMKFTCGAKVVIQTKRGIEMGEQVSQTCHGCDKSVTRDQMRAWVETCGEDSFVFDAGRILREATAADLAEYAHIQGDNPARKRFCQSLADRRELPLRVVDCEALFGGERIIFYFTAEERVDFRTLVKELAQEYRTRIEMRQVGARDEARLLADYETCGREVCCKVFLKTLRPVSMRMAKVQKATLDPSQVSGRCGRLKCCLRYEHVAYEELDKRLPRNGVRIRTAHGEGVVVNRQILTQLVQIRKDDGTLLTVVIEDVTEVDVPPPEPGQEAGRTGPGDRAARGNRGRARGGSRSSGQTGPDRPGETKAGDPGRDSDRGSTDEGRMNTNGEPTNGTTTDAKESGEGSAPVRRGSRRSSRVRRRRGRGRGRGSRGEPGENQGGGDAGTSP